MIFPLLRHITHRLTGLAAVAAILATTLWSCSDFEPEFGGGADGDGTVSFRVVAPKYAGANRGSRATWGNDYDKLGGTEFETALLEDQVQVIITDASCENRYAITDLYCKKVQDNPLFVTYEYVGRIEEADLDAMRKAGSGKLHVIANAGVGADLNDELKFTRSGLASEFESIPMWGVQSVDFSKLLPNNALSIGDVNLLRSMAKVVIDNSEDADNYIQSITDVTISTSNGQGYVLPAGWTAIASTSTLDRHAARVPEQTPAGAKKYTMDEKSHVEFYLPEIFNGAGDDEITLTINYKTLLGDRTGKLYFRRYADGNPGDTPLDVLRNYQYHFIVKKPNHEEVNAILDVIPYSSVMLDPDFGLERDPINGWVCFRNPQGFLMCYYDEINKVFYDFDRQRITFDQHDTKKSWLKVLDAKGNFQWYFDVETGNMYDRDDQLMTGLDRHEVTGWLVHRLPDGKVDYYVAPLANKVYDRNLNEVELESRDGTGNYKLLRDGDGNIIIKFDPLSGEVVGSDDKPFPFSYENGNKDRIIIDTGKWYCLYDRTTGLFYNSQGTQIKNPFANPSWQQYLYTNGSLICYYDNETGKFYDIDLDVITFGFHENKPWFKVVDSDGNFCWYLDYTTGAMYDEQDKRLNPERDRTTGNLIRRDSKDKIAYYVDPVSLLVYDSSQNLVRLDHRNQDTNALKTLHYTGAGGPATYFFDAAAGALYGAIPSSTHESGFTVDRTNVIYDYLNKRESQFERDPNNQARVIIPNDNGGTFRYYDIDKSQFYAENGIPVSNPFSTQLTPYDDIKNDAGQFICFYNQIDGKFYDGYMREIVLDKHPSKTWFKVCDHSGYFKWYVDYLTLKLYNENGTEMTSPALYHNLNGTDVRITSGKRDAKTGRVEFIHYRGPVKGTTSYWLDPVSLVMYDRSMREVVLPRSSERANSLRQFKKNGTTLFDFDALTCQFYQNGTPKELNANYVNCVDELTNKKTVYAGPPPTSGDIPNQTLTGFKDASPATYTITAGSHAEVGLNAFRFDVDNEAGIVSTESGGKLKSVTLAGHGNYRFGTMGIYEGGSKYTTIKGLYSSNPDGTLTGSSLTYNAKKSDDNSKFVGIRPYVGRTYLSTINIEWTDIYVLSFYDQSDRDASINFRPCDEAFHSTPTSNAVKSGNIIKVNPFVRQQ